MGVLDAGACGGSALDEAFDAADEQGDVWVKVRPGINSYRVTVSKFGERFRKLTGGRYLGVANENGDDEAAGFEGELKLKPDEVRRLVQPSLPIRSPTLPVLPDNRQQDATLENGLANVRPEIHTQWHRAYIHEHIFVSKVFPQAVVYPAGDVGRPVASVGDKDLHGDRPQVFADQMSPASLGGHPSEPV